MRPSLYSKLLRYLLFTSSLLFLSLSSSLAQNLPAKHILLLNSYHQNMDWAANIIQAVNDTLQPDNNNLVLHIENLDSKHFYSSTYQEAFASFIKEKYQRTKIELILSADDNALIFLQQYRDHLFPSVPVVFCGVNNLVPERISIMSQVTGVEEIYDAASTLQLALKIHPDTTDVLVVNDFLTTGRATELKMRQQLAPFGKNIMFHYAPNKSLKELNQQIRSLKPGTLVLLGAFFSDSQKQYSTYFRMGQQLVQGSQVPIYCIFRFNVGGGVIGGKVTSAYSQGTHMAIIASEILKGGNADQIPIVKTGTTDYIFDYQALHKYAVSEKLLPKNSEIINRPYSVYQQYKKEIWLTAIAITLLALIILALLISIRRRHKVERQLRDSELKLKNIFNQSYDFIGLLSPAGLIQDINQTAVDFSGVDKQQLLNQPFWKTPFWNYSAQEQQKLQQAIGRVAMGHVERIETTHFSATGNACYFDSTIAPILDEQGKVIMLLSSARDMTLRREMEQQLKENEDYQRMLIEHSPIGLVLSRKNGQIKSVNPAFADIIGYSVAEAEGLTNRQITPEEHLPAEWTQLEQLEQTGRYGPYEKELRHKHGHLVPVRLHGQLFKRKNQEYIWSSVENITEQRTSQAHKEELEEQLRQRQKLEALGTLAGGIAHDFNNILAAILGYSQLLLRHPDNPDKVSKHAGDLQSAALRGSDLVRQILAFSRKGAEDLHPVQIHQVIEEAVGLLRQTLPRTIHFALNIDQRSGWIEATATLLHQIVMNLGTNAFQAIGNQQGEIGISLRAVQLTTSYQSSKHSLPAGHYALLKISDSGAGIPAAVMEHIFDPFFTTKKAGEGTGLGLAVVHGIVQKLKGHIEVNSSDREGTIFSVWFPLCKRPLQTANDESAPQPPVAGNEHILWVDDEEMLLNLGKELLEPIGYQITTVTSAVQAIQLFRENPSAFQLIISDQTMPAMTGDQLAREVFKIRKEIPFILCTGNSNVIDADQAALLGIKTFLMKPIDIRTLLDSIRNCLD